MDYLNKVFYWLYCIRERMEMLPQCLDEEFAMGLIRMHDASKNYCRMNSPSKAVY